MHYAARFFGGTLARIGLLMGGRKAFQKLPPCGSHFNMKNAMTESSANLSVLRPGYPQVKAASLLPRDAEAWEPFVRNVLGLPLSMLPEVQQPISRKTWMLAKDPLEQVRNAATNWAGRMCSTMRQVCARHNLAHPPRYTHNKLTLNAGFTFPRITASRRCSARLG